MIKESRYILRRILIGVGIVLVLSCLNGCKVKALTLFSGVEVPDVDNIVGDNAFYITYYDSSQLRLLYQPSNVDNLYLRDGKPDNWIGSSRIYSLPITTNGNNITVKSNARWTYKGTVSQDYGVWLYNDETALSCLNYYYTNTGSCRFNDLHPYHSYFNKNILYSNGDIFRNISLYSAYLPSQQPSFVSFNAIPITTNNVITSYTVQPEFSSFDTDNYVYQYSFDSNRWLSLTENEQILRINNNSTIYVRVKDKNTNEYIDGSTFTISNIGTFYNEQTYDIKFSGEYRTTNYLSNNVSSKSSSIISEYQIYIDYLPKSSLLTYQYQYVVSGDSLVNDNWENVPNSDNGSITYVASENGTLYARILDKENNVLKTGTFTVNSIGKLAFDNSNNKFTDFYTSLRNKIDFGGPIGSLINIPITLLQTISDSFNGMTGVCSNYNLGNLFGYNLYLPCVNVKHYLGNTLYNTIDIIISCVMIYFIFKMLSNAYYQFLLLESTPIPEDMSNSLNVSYRRF